MSLQRYLRTAEYVFLATGIIACGYWAFAFFGAQTFQTREARAFTNEIRAQPPLIPEPKPVQGAVFAQLSIPRLGLTTMVVEGDDDGDLKKAIGHIPGTVLPGEHGNAGLAGHRDSFFRPLEFIRKNDRIDIKTLDGIYNYRVVSTEIVDPSDVQVLDPTGRDTVTLVTCYPFHFIGSAPKRFIVRAERAPDAGA